MLEFIFILFLTYIFYKVLTNFIIPLWNFNSRLQSGIKNAQSGNAAPREEHTGRTPKKAKKKEGEYIDFEELP